MTTRAGLIAACLLTAAAAIAQPAGSVILTSDFLQIGVSDNGTLGVGGSTDPGIVFDATGTRTFDPVNDYLTPGIPAEGFSVSYTGSGGVVFNDNSSAGSAAIGPAAAVTALAPGTNGFDSGAQWSGSIAGVLTVEHFYGINDGDSNLTVRTTITAQQDLDNLQYARYIDPDSGGFNSINTRGNAALGIAPEDFVNSESEVNGATLGLFTESDTPHNSAVASFGDNNPATYVAGSGDQVGDLYIGIGFDIGTLLLGESILLEYLYAVAPDPDDFMGIGGTFSENAETFNQRAVAAFLDDSAGTANPTLAALLTELGGLSVTEQLAAIDALSGAFYGSLPAANLQHTSHYLDQIARRLRSRVKHGAANRLMAWTPRVAPCEQTGGCDGDSDVLMLGQSPCYIDQRSGWIAGYGLVGEAYSDGNADGFEYQLGGTQFAIDRPITCDTNIGFWGNLAWSQVEGQQLDERADLENYHFGHYLVYGDRTNYAMAIGGIGYDTYESTRNVTAGSINGVASGDFSGWQGNFYGERGLGFCHGPWFAQAYGGLQYLYLRQNSFQETGAAAVALDVAGLDVQSLRSVLGTRISTVRALGGRISPNLRAVWLHEFLDSNQLINVGPPGAASPAIGVRGVDLGRDWVILGGGFDYALSRNARIFTNYDVQFNENQALHVGSGGLELLW